MALLDGRLDHKSIRVDLIEQESDDLRLENVRVVLIDLEMGLDHGKRLFGKASLLFGWIDGDVFDHLDEVIAINDALIDLLVVFLQFSKHLVYFGLDEIL